MYKIYNDVLFINDITYKSNKTRIHSGIFVEKDNSKIIFEALHVLGKHFNSDTKIIDNVEIINESLRKYNLNSLKCEVVNRPCIFGGYFFPHFGHFFHESLSRLALLSKEYCLNSIDGIDDSINSLQIYICKTWGNNIIELIKNGFMGQVIKGFGIDCNKFKLLSEPTFFKKIIIPIQLNGLGFGHISWSNKYKIDTLGSFKKFMSGYIAPWRQSPISKTDVKVYVSRRKFNGSKYLNEIVLENALKYLGFEIFHPQEHSFEIQFEKYRSANHLVFADGSSVYTMTLFGKQVSNLKTITLINRRRGKSSKGIFDFLKDSLDESLICIECINEVSSVLYEKNGNVDQPFSLINIPSTINKIIKICGIDNEYELDQNLQSICYNETNSYVLKNKYLTSDPEKFSNLWFLMSGLYINKTVNMTECESELNRLYQTMKSINLKSDLINFLIKKINAKKYLEIGIGRGNNFREIKCEYKVGIDFNKSSKATIYKTSDEFFETNTEFFDVIFIDGLHHCDQVYKDIINSLKFLNSNGYIVCHDMNPPSEIIQRIPRKKGQIEWTGDCWKAWVKIRSEFNDLSMYVINIDWGCGVIYRGIDPSSKLLFELPKDAFELEYQYLDENRKKLLNLITVNEFFKLIC